MATKCILTDIGFLLLQWGLLYNKGYEKSSDSLFDTDGIVIRLSYGKLMLHIRAEEAERLNRASLKSRKQNDMER